MALLRYVGGMNPILISSRPFDIQGREPHLCGFVKIITFFVCLFFVFLLFRHLLADFFRTWFDGKDH